MFPNPANSQLNFSDVIPNSILQITSPDGKVVFQSLVNNAYEKVNINQLSEGVYIVKLFINNQNYFINKLLIKY